MPRPALRSRPRVVILPGSGVFGFHGPRPLCDSHSVARRVSGGGGFMPCLGRMRGLVGPGRLAGYALPPLRGR